MQCSQALQTFFPALWSCTETFTVLLAQTQQHSSTIQDDAATYIYVLLKRTPNALPFCLITVTNMRLDSFPSKIMDLFFSWEEKVQQLKKNDNTLKFCKHNAQLESYCGEIGALYGIWKTWQRMNGESCVGILIIYYVSYLCWKVMQGNFDVYIAAIKRKDRVFPRYIFLLLMQFSFA